MTPHISRSVDGDGRVRDTAEIAIDHTRSSIWLDRPGHLPEPPALGDVFGCLLLLPAMRRAAGLDLPGSTSPGVVRALRGPIQDIYRCWDARLARIDVAAPDETVRPTPDNVGLFFSGGVDSLYSLLKHENEITHLILVHGFDIAATDEALWSQTVRRLGKTADRFGKELITVRTNLRTFTDPIANWELYHGGALAAVGHSLAGVLGRIYIGSTHSYADLFPWGSHPLLDPLWSSDALTFVHDGAECNRVEKVERLAERPECLEHLRVCWKNPGGAYNCGRCEKCLRTMINLACVGALDAYPAFGDARLDLDRVRSMRLAGDNGLAFARENLDAVTRRGCDERLAAALRAAIDRRGSMPHAVEQLAKRAARRLLPRKPRRAVAPAG